jgi:hypothetical protein
MLDNMPAGFSFTVGQGADRSGGEVSELDVVYSIQVMRKKKYDDSGIIRKEGDG